MKTFRTLMRSSEEGGMIRSSIGGGFGAPGAGGGGAE